MFTLIFALLAAPDTVEMSLSQAIDVALKRSPAHVEGAVSRTQSVLTLANGINSLLPSATGSVSYGRTTSTSPLLPETTVTGWTGNLTLNQVIFDPQIYAGLASSVVYTGYYCADARDKRARLIYDATSSYLGLLTSRLLRDAAASALDRANDNLRLTQEKLRLGAASQIDVMRSDVFRSQAEISLLTAEKALGVANAAFLATAGITGNVVVKPTETLTTPADFAISDPDSLIAEIERRNPGARLAAKANIASKLSLAGTAGRILPSVSAYWSTDYTGQTFPSGVKKWDNNDNVSYGLRLSFPLLDLKSYVLDIAGAANDARRANAAAASARLQVRSSAIAAVLSYQEARQRYDYARRNLELNQELYRLAQQQQRLGAISLIDFFSVETNLTQAQATHVSALSDTYIQAAQISYLLGQTRPAAEGH